MSVPNSKWVYLTVRSFNGEKVRTSIIIQLKMADTKLHFIKFDWNYQINDLISNYINYEALNRTYNGNEGNHLIYQIKQ